MAETRSKLLVLGGPDVSADAVTALLQQQFNVVALPPNADQGAALDAVNDPEVRAVLAGASDFLSLERQVVAAQANRLLDAIGEGVCLCDRAGRTIWTSDRFEALPPVVREQVFGACRSAAARLAASDPDQARAASGAGGPRPLRRCKFGVEDEANDRHFEAVVSPVLPADRSEDAGPDRDGESQADSSGAEETAPAESLLVAVLWDTSAAYHTQQKLEAIDEAGRELIQIDTESVRKLNAAERLEMLERKIIGYAQQLLHFDHFAIRLLDADSGRLDLVMSHGFSREALENEFYVSEKGSGITGYVASTQRSYICRDTATDSRYVTGITQAASSLTIPLILRDELIGVLNVESNEIDAFDEDDQRFAEIFARYVAMALHILGLLVVERYTTNEALSDVMQGEVSEPLEDLAVEAEWLRTQSASAQDPGAARHIDRILKDVDSIRRRVRDVARGPRSILGAERAMRTTHDDPLLKNRSILVADDEPTIRETITTVLQQHGCRVTSCPDGASAIEQLSKAGESDSPVFDLVISDIKMPDRNGYEVFSAAKREGIEAPVILMTGFGYDPHHSIVRASQEGLQCVLFKPFQIDRLLEEVRKAIEKQDAGE